ncbi:MAG: hexose kinase [Chitinivibrionia bacterium]|nr:hexose kinase [Chitinivibrionia bacterium]
MIRAVLYNSAIDVHYKIPKFGEQTDFIGLNSVSFPAGKAINFAKAAKILGEEVEVSGLVGSGDITRFRNFLDDYKIAHDLFEVSGDTRINTTIYEEKSGISYHLNSKNKPILDEEISIFNKKLMEKINVGDFLAFSGSVPEGYDEEIYRKLIEECKIKNAKVALDTRGNPLKYGLSALPFLISPNETEFQFLFGDEVKGLHNIILKGKRLIESGIENVFITLGKDGVVALNKNECFRCLPPEIEEPINSVGCGDAFLAGAVVGFVRGFDFSEVCRMATASGALNTLTHEPCKINRDKVGEVMEKVKIERI